MRSLLFVPGNKPSMLEKARKFAPDAFIPDMEDSVPDAEKAAARNTIHDFLPKLSKSGILVIPRVNALHTGWLEHDLEAIVGPYIHGISVGKIDTPEDIKLIANLIGELEDQADLPVGKIKLIPWIETAKAIVNCYEICCSSDRILGVALGAEDLTNDMGIERREDESNVAYPKSVLCIAARAAEIMAFDTPYFRFKDEEGLRDSIATAKQQGFKGKFAIHPAQVNPINEGFAPSANEIEYARRVVTAFEEAERSGRGSTQLDGVVVDVPVAKRARKILELTDSD